MIAADDDSRPLKSTPRHGHFFIFKSHHYFFVLKDIIYYPPEVRKGEYWGWGVFLLQYFPLVKI